MPKRAKQCDVPIVTPSKCLKKAPDFLTLQPRVGPTVSYDKTSRRFKPLQPDPGADRKVLKVRSCAVLEPPLQAPVAAHNLITIDVESDAEVPSTPMPKAPRGEPDEVPGKGEGSPATPSIFITLASEIEEGNKQHINWHEALMDAAGTQPTGSTQPTGTQPTGSTQSTLAGTQSADMQSPRIPPGMVDTFPYRQILDDNLALHGDDTVDYVIGQREAGVIQITAETFQLLRERCLKQADLDFRLLFPAKRQ